MVGEFLERRGLIKPSPPLVHATITPDQKTGAETKTTFIAHINHNITETLIIITRADRTLILFEITSYLYLY